MLRAASSTLRGSVRWNTALVCTASVCICSSGSEASSPSSEAAHLQARDRRAQTWQHARSLARSRCECLHNAGTERASRVGALQAAARQQFAVLTPCM